MMPQLVNRETGQIIETAQQPVWVAGIWECGDVRFVDLSGHGYAPAPPAPPIPFSVAIWRAKAVLTEMPFDPLSAQTAVQPIVAGCTNLEAAAQALITAQGNVAVSSFWASGGDILRESPALASISSLLNLTPSQVDALFIDAQNIPPI